MELLLFHSLVVAHILTGTTGAIAFWVPVIGRKGGGRHRRWGRVFTFAMLATGSLAVMMSLLTLLDPLGTHPHLEGRFDAAFLRGMFGWMMLHTGILTINLAWYGYLCITNKGRHAANRTKLNLGLQYAVMAAALVCAAQGWIIGQPLMIGIAVVGLATGLTNLWFLHKPRVERQDWLKEHIKALVGAGISVYTAFMAFGSVRVFPELALHPAMWSLPLVVGLAIIIWHRLGVERQARRRVGAVA
ncbi:hypothetical protein [Falsiroseomonas selenitidurans]|uniref:DUF2306 domain-containing protein n=1 Tax=Falsiroseomonas selenitidurans TaxID=2716335 RepID=A0ABX1E9P4_9PROT|nr:hypothetical protein [Falsiroseomonas selenitidurans]NKC33959.1 hypothetical protein [Falsiroseomonas selenitidurans]